MAAYLIDTDTLSLFQRDHPRVLAQVAAHAGDRIAVSAVTIEEQISGWSRLARSARTPAQQEFASAFLVPTWGRVVVVPMTVASLAVFDQLIRRKLNVRGDDLRIAAVALDAGATVVTRNARDFARVPGLAWEDWSV